MQAGCSDRTGHGLHYATLLIANRAQKYEGDLAASMRDGCAFCMRDDAAAIERSVRLDRCN